MQGKIIFSIFFIRMKMGFWMNCTKWQAELLRIILNTQKIYLPNPEGMCILYLCLTVTNIAD